MDKPLKHTPGPWSWEGSKRHGICIENGPDVVVSFCRRGMGGRLETATDDDPGLLQDIKKMQAAREMVVEAVKKATE